jgi:VWFA-related protein
LGHPAVVALRAPMAVGQTEPAMHRFPSLALIGGVLLAYFCLACLPLSAQENRVLRVGVAILQSEPGKVSGTEARDRLVKVLNQRKPDKNSHFSLEAVPLDASSQAKATAEAREKNCEYVLSTQLTRLQTTSSIVRPNGSALDTVPVFEAAVEYQLTRALDGAAFAIGAAKAEDTTSFQEVVWQTVAQVADKAMADMAKAGRVSPGESRTAEIQANKLTPGQDEAARTVSNFCGWLPDGIPHGDALPGVCEYVTNLAEKMPNFICHQEASRYRGNGRAPTDLIALSVRYEDGNESYSEIKVNGRPATIETAQSTGLWSSGEFGSSNLRSIFNPRNQVVFEFAREGRLGEHAAWIFPYKIAKQNEPLWILHAADQVVAPPYGGELWVDQKTGGVLRFESIAKDVPKNFPIARAEQQVDYESVGFADGSSFVLPVDFNVLTIVGGEKTRNVVRLTDCHKFRGKGRLILNAESGAPGAASTAQIPPSVASVQADLDESEQTFFAIREQTVQESESRREAEQEQMLDAVTAATQQRLSQLRAVAVADDTLRTTFRVNVSQVPVSVVLRDGAGRAVGSMGQDNFRLFDEGRPQVITQFSVESAASNNPADQTAATVPVQAGLPAMNQSGPATLERDMAYLFDDIHSNAEDLAGASASAGRRVGLLNAGERIAIFTTSGTVTIDFTEDREKLLAGLRTLKPHALVSESDCPSISYYMAYLMTNQRDQAAEVAAVAEVMDCAFHGTGTVEQAQHLADAKAVEVLHAGGVESGNALVALEGVIRRAGAMPGQRTIVLVSPGFLALTPDLLEGVTALVEGAVRAGIVINSLDPHGRHDLGVYGKFSLRGQNSFLLASAEAQALGDVMAEFSSGTGGIFFHNNNNDLDEGFRRTAAAPEFVYVLGFSPQKLDGKFHKLKVTLNGAGKIDVQARLGYYAPKPVGAK